jgi:hypothetical protein
VPATPATTAAASDGFDPHPSYIATPVMSGHNSSTQLAGNAGLSSPTSHELAAFLGEADPVDSWVSTHCQGALQLQGAWSRQQSRASTRRDSSGNNTTAAAAAATAGAVEDDSREADLISCDSPTSIPMVAAAAAAAAASGRPTMDAYEAASAAGCSSRRHSSASVAAAGMRRSSGLDHELSIGWRDCRRSSSARHSDGLQQVCELRTWLLTKRTCTWIPRSSHER